MSEEDNEQRSSQTPIVLAPPPSPSSPSDDTGTNSDDHQDSFEDLFNCFSQQWLYTQLTHHVSLSATNSFWQLSMKYIPDMMEAKKRDNIKKKISQFVQVRKNIFKDISPKFKMTFCYMNKEDGTQYHVSENYTPLTQFQRDPRYQKLYEQAQIEVINLLTNYLLLRNDCSCTCNCQSFRVAICLIM